MSETIKVRLPNGVVMKNIPKGTSKDAIMNKAINSGLAKFDDFGGEEDFSLSEMVSNIPSSAGQLVTDMTAPIHSPIQTAKGVRSLLEGGLSKFLGWDSPDEDTVDQAANALSERYGSWNKIKNSFERDPAGVLSDVAGIISGGGGLAAKTGIKAGNIASKTGMAIDPVNMALNTTKAAITKLMPDDMPNDMLQSAMKFSNAKLSETERTKLADTMMKYDIMPNQKGMNKAERITLEKANEVSKIINDLEASGVRPTVKRIDQAVYDAGLKYGDLGYQTNLENVLNIDKEYSGWRTQLPGGTLSPKQMQNYKSDLYKTANYGDMYAGSKSAKERILDPVRKDKARAAKETLEMLDDTGTLKNKNAELGALLSLSTPLAKSAGRIANRDLMGIGVPIKMGALEAMFPGGSYLGAALGALDTPLNKAGLAIKTGRWQNQNLVDMLMDNSLKAEMLRQMAVQAGRLEDELN